MAISLAEVIAAFRGSIALNCRILQEQYQVQSFEIAPDPASPLQLKDAAGVPLPLYLPLDRIIGQSTLINRQWDTIKQDFLRHRLKGDAQPLTLIDVGANIGLFSRQCLNRLPQIEKILCYEPNPSNFRLLSRNLSGMPNVHMYNFGLSDAPGVLDFHVDPNNVGNCSLNREAMPQGHATIQVRIAAAGEESRRWLDENDGAFLYKSDTQGFDEIISTAILPEFWERVKAGIFELWRLPGKGSYDVDRFVALLDSFPNKVFEKAPNANISSRDVLAYLDGTDMQYSDLYFWR